MRALESNKGCGHFVPRAIWVDVCLISVSLPVPVDQVSIPGSCFTGTHFTAYIFAIVSLVFVMGIGADDDVRKLQFTFDALQQQQDPFMDPVVLDPDLLEAVSWSASRSAAQAGLLFTQGCHAIDCVRVYCACCQVMREREAIISDLERRAALHWQNGHCESWLVGADPHVKRVSATVCGPLLEEVCVSTKYWDKSCTQPFREGILFAFIAFAASCAWWCCVLFRCCSLWQASWQHLGLGRGGSHQFRVRGVGL